MNLLKGLAAGTGNQSSRLISPLVCSSMRRIKSGMVIRLFSRSFLEILPVNATG